MQKIGILGGGQLGRMLLQVAANYPVITYVLENDPDCPAAHLCHHFIKGDIRNFDDVYKFGCDLDSITIEIESVNEEALEQLEKEGVKIYPKTRALKIIKHKILQKQFYVDNEIPTAPFHITGCLADLTKYSGLLPAMHKVSKGGFDGRGVIPIKTVSDFEKGFDEPAVLEKSIDIIKEISIIIAVGNDGKTAIYPAVEMMFDPRLNLLNYQLSPARLDEKVLWKIEAIALRVVKCLDSPGLFAVELFVDHENNIWVNETAPRVHNSGHHTIESNYSSQFDMLWRIMLNYPLGNTRHILPSAIVNLVGSPNHSGSARYKGIENILKLDNVFLHLYGKTLTKPGRKMGHVTILSSEPQELIHTALKIKEQLTVISESQ